MQITYASTAPESGALAVFVAADNQLSHAAQAAEAATDGQLGRALKAARFDGKAGKLVEILAPAGMPYSRLLAIGLGDPAKADAAAFEKAGGTLAAKLLTSGETEVTVDMTGMADLGCEPGEAAARLALGAELRAWRADQYRTKLPDDQKPTLTSVTVVGAPETATAAHGRLAGLADGVFLTRALCTEPANIIYPETFVERAQSLTALGVKVSVLGEDEMRALGMGSLLCVSLGSDREAKLLIMEWPGTGAADAQPVALIGKGVTFDTGGISIKPAAGMEDMKWDMGGAGAVTGAMHAIAARKSPQRVVGLCGLVENMPDGKATRPGDVVTSMSGQTIEVINTDAEGRLVLADVIWYAQQTFRPHTMVDLATLTGAIIISLGHEHAGLFSNDDDLAARLSAAGTATGEALWRLPLGEAYDKLIDSPIADMKNVGDRGAGSITAAQFLQRFVQDGVKWAHLDVAGTVWAAKDSALYAKGATGFGVRLLDRFIAGYEA